MLATLLLHQDRLLLLAMLDHLQLLQLLMLLQKAKKHLLWQ